MTSPVRRWLSIDGLLTCVLVANWVWFAVIVFTIGSDLTQRRAGFGPGPKQDTAGSVTSPAVESPLAQFQIAPQPLDKDALTNNPVLFILVVVLILASVLMTLTDQARRQGRRPLAIAGLGGCAVAGMGFVAIQTYRFLDPAFASPFNIYSVVLFDWAESLSLNLVAGLALLVLSAILMLVRQTGETPSLAEQVTTWHWHALDTFWLILVALSWHWGVMGVL